MLISYLDADNLCDTLKKTQSILFDIGSHLASDGKADDYLPALDNTHIQVLEDEMDRMDAELPALKTFILPGGNQRISVAHVCRTVCRRAERRVVSLTKHKEVDSFIKVYLNRLSDYFFVLARYLAKIDGIDEVKWNPK